MRTSSLRRIRLGQLVGLLVSLALLLAAAATPASAVTAAPQNTASYPPAAFDPLDPIIDNGSLVQLGINPTGELNVPGGTPSLQAGTTYVGLRYIPTNGESTAPGCLCEGWGVANADAATGQFAGYANQAIDGGAQFMDVTTGTGVYAGPAGESKLLPESLGTRFKSVVLVPSASAPRLKVTQDYRPSPITPNLYEDVVTVENVGATAVGDLRYRRVMDWDIAPTTFFEWSEIHVGNAANLVTATSDGFQSGNPLSSPGPSVGVPPTTLTSGSPDYFSGPADQGALFDFTFGSLAPGATKSFKIFYGAAENRAKALDAVTAVGAEVYSLGMANEGGSSNAPATNGPHAFIFAFSGVGGDPVGTIKLEPTTQTHDTGQQANLKATVKEDGVLKANVSVTFKVTSGPNAGTLGTATTDSNGEATISYTGTGVGTDLVQASYTDASSAEHKSNVATVEWTGATNTPPTADAGGPYTVPEGGSVGLAGGGSDAESAISYAWDLDNNGSFETSGQNPTFSAAGLDGPSSRTVKLRTTDAGGLTATATATVNITNVAPTLKPFTVASVACGTASSFSYAFTDPGVPDTHTYAADWGDTAPATGTAVSGGTLSHTYTHAGAHSVSLQITDDDGASDTESASATVNYTWSGGGILQPINYTGPRSLFKYGSTIPVKVKLVGCDGTPISTLAPKVTYRITSGDPPSSGDLEAVSTSAADTGNTMRWTGGPDNQYIFNLNTKAITADPTVTMRIFVTVPETGQVTYADVGLKK